MLAVMMPTPDLAVPYEAPKHENVIAETHPIAPKNGSSQVSEKIARLQVKLTAYTGLRKSISFVPKIYGELTSSQTPWYGQRDSTLRVEILRQC